MQVQEELAPLACTINAAAGALGVSRRQIYRLINNGTLSKLKAGGRSLIPITDLRVFTDGGTSHPSTELRSAQVGGN
ncbi:MAG TPA: helix-turn-helix domain-containing protein [Sphingobium sp.]